VRAAIAAAVLAAGWENKGVDAEPLQQEIIYAGKLGVEPMRRAARKL